MYNRVLGNCTTQYINLFEVHQKKFRMKLGTNILAHLQEDDEVSVGARFGSACVCRAEHLSGILHRHDSRRGCVQPIGAYGHRLPDSTLRFIRDILSKCLRHFFNTMPRRCRRPPCHRGNCSHDCR